MVIRVFINSRSPKRPAVGLLLLDENSLGFDLAAELETWRRRLSLYFLRHSPTQSIRPGFVLANRRSD